MNQGKPVILHHKYSLADGHVTAQINNVEGYQGLMLTTASKQYRNQTPFQSVLSLKEIVKKPKLLTEKNVVAVHVHHGNLAYKFKFLKEEHGIPLFIGFRGKDATAYPKKKKNLVRLQEMFAVGDLFFPVCHHLKKEIIKLGCPESKIRVLYGGVDLSRFEYRPRKVKKEGRIRFLAVGRYVEKKGFTELIKAFAKVKEKNKEAKLKIIGEGPLRVEYEKLINLLGLKGSVKLQPWVDYRKIQEEYHKAHIFCAPSLTDQNGNQEGIPNTLKEAMATGMPVISTNHAGIPELVQHNLSGLLVPEQSVKKLARSMNWLANHPQYWGELGENGRKQIELNFNLPRQLEKQKMYYNEIINSVQSR